jgi:hypothetical protein
MVQRVLEGPGEQLRRQVDRQELGLRVDELVTGHDRTRQEALRNAHSLRGQHPLARAVLFPHRRLRWLFLQPRQMGNQATTSLMHTSVFVGNGINQIRGATFSWANVLVALASACGRPDLAQGKDQKPFTLLFEEMVLCSGYSLEQEERLKVEVANLVKQITPISIHQRIRSIGVPNILTPNYDYALEDALVDEVTAASTAYESRYSLFRRRRSGKQFIWHIHGEADKPSTITLGHDQYVGYLAKAKAYLTSGVQRSNGREWRSPFMMREPAFDVGEGTFSWVDLFLRDNIHILGFGLDYSEIAIWWLITYKARLRAGHSRNAKSINVGDTYYYYVFPDESSARDQARLQLLKSLGVKVQEFNAGVGYNNAMAAYETAVDTIEGAI